MPTWKRDNFLAWYVILLMDPNDPKGTVHAEVTQFKDAADYTAHTGTNPDKVLPDAWQGLNGFPNRLAAAAVAAKFNALPADQRQAGSGKIQTSSSFLPSLTNPLDSLKFLADFFHRLTQPQTWIRVTEVGIGALLIYLALKAVMTPGGVPVASRNAAHTFKDTGKKLAKLAVYK
jgi:hypothetical protein